MARTPTLHVVARPERPGTVAPALGDDGDLGDLALTATILAISSLPLVATAAHLGTWSPGDLGLGAAGSLFAARELWTCARAALRTRRHP